MVVTSSNLTLQERLQLPENLAGKSVLSSDSNTLYAISESGVTVLPVGSLAQQPQVVAQQEDLVFRGSFCNPGVSTQQLTIVDPGGNNTPFSISSDTAGVSVSPAGRRHAGRGDGGGGSLGFRRIKPGTVAAHLTIQSGHGHQRHSERSGAGQQRRRRIRWAASSTSPERSPTSWPTRCSTSSTSLRSDKNEVLVFDGTNYSQIADAADRQPADHHGHFLRSAISAGRKSGIANRQRIRSRHAASPPRPSFCRRVSSPIRSPPPPTPRLRRAATTTARIHILQLDIPSGTGTELPTLGVFTNITNANTVMTASQNGSSIFIAQADGTVYLYDANSNSFTVSRQGLHLAGRAVRRVGLQSICGRQQSSRTLRWFR